MHVVANTRTRTRTRRVLLHADGTVLQGGAEALTSFYGHEKAHCSRVASNLSKKRAVPNDTEPPRTATRRRHAKVVPDCTLREEEQVVAEFLDGCVADCVAFCVADTNVTHEDVAHMLDMCEAEVPPDSSELFPELANVVPEMVDGDMQPRQKKMSRQWSQAEDSALKAIMESAPQFQKWAVVAEQVRAKGVDRTAKQCRERYFNHLKKGVNKDPMTDKEIELAVCLWKVLGSQWSVIAKQLGNGRTDNFVKNSLLPTVRSEFPRARAAQKRAPRCVVQPSIQGGVVLSGRNAREEEALFRENCTHLRLANGKTLSDAHRMDYLVSLDESSLADELACGESLGAPVVLLVQSDVSKEAFKITIGDSLQRREPHFARLNAKLAGK